MRYEDCLVRLLEPLGVYDLGPGTVNRGELTCYGELLDRGMEDLEESEREMSLATAESFGLKRVGELLPYRPESSTVELQRAALAALLRIGGDSFTPEAINHTLAGCGINAKARETGEPNHVEVWFPDVAGVPEGFERIRYIIEEILPCQLGIAYVFWYLTWSETAEKFETWGAIREKGLNWVELRSFVK